MNNFNSSFVQNQSLNPRFLRNPSLSCVMQSSSNPQSLTDQNLYSLCKTYGARALEWRRKFTGLLPEVNRRKLYEKKGFESIFVFAKKLAGLSEDQVRLTLNLEKRFENLPALWSPLVNGEVSVNKLARVASIANLENQEFLASQVRILSKSAVETLVRDEKFARSMWLFGDEGRLPESRFLDNFDSRRQVDYENRNGLFEPEIGSKFVPGHKSEQSTLGEKWSSAENRNGFLEPRSDCKSLHVQTFGELNLSSEVQRKLLELQQKGLDLNQLLLEFLKKREEEIAQKKLQIAEGKQNQNDVKISSPSRYIPRAVRKIIHEEHGTKCSIRTCQKTAKTIHYMQRFSLSRSHDPHYLAPLCKDHHELAHACDAKYGEVKREYLEKIS